MRHSSGKYAHGFSDRSGFRYPLTRMKREWTGALVGPDEYEGKHPQIDPPRVPRDPQSLRNPRPDPGGIPVIAYAGRPTFDAPDNKPIIVLVRVGGVEVDTP